MSGYTPTTSRATGLPSLPLELQIAILALLPPNQLFVLCRVSNSWSAMLCNHNLLNAINDRIPYLTSAPDLASRMKRRMRMARGEPVWVKPFAEAFPSWSAELDAERTPYPLRSWIKFWGGFFVLLHAPLNGPLIEPLNASSLRLVIKDLARRGNQDVEVDILALFQKANPKVYKEWMEEVQDQVVTRQVRYSQLHLQDGKVVVGLHSWKERRRPAVDACINQYTGTLDKDRRVTGT